MGKRNRKLKKVREPITKSKIMAKVLPGFLNIIESKEKFVENLKGVFAKYKKEFGFIVQGHVKNAPVKPNKRINAENFTRSDFHYHDQSGELVYIYKLQLNSFVCSILETLREIFYQNRQIMKVCLKDAEVIVMNALKETENLTSGVFSEDEELAGGFVGVYQDKVMKDPIVIQFYMEENAIVEIKDLISKQNVDVKEGKRKREKKKKKEEVVEDQVWNVDLEVEEFRKKLELEFIKDIRQRPNITLDWIAGIKKKLVRA